MKLEKQLRKMGIEEKELLTNEQKESVAIKVTDLLVNSFPILHNTSKDILNKLLQAKMRYAVIDKKISNVNYIYNNNTIYFSQDMNLDVISDTVIHEVIHYLQDYRKKNGKLNKIGLCNFNELSVKGLGLNEASVQYISSKAIKRNPTLIKKYTILIKTISPYYYPVITNLIEQIVFLIGEDNLVKSIIENDNKFEDDFINTFEENAQLIVGKFDDIIEINNEINNKNNLKKQEELANLFIYTQDLIMKTYFKKQYKLINSEEDIIKISEKINKYMDIAGKVEIDGFTYNNSERFKTYLLNKLDKKMLEIHSASSKTALAIVYTNRLNKIIKKIKSYFGI